MSSCKTKGYIIAATKKRKKDEDKVRRGILAMNGFCAQNNAPKASRNKRSRLKKNHEKKTPKDLTEEYSGEVGICTDGEDNNNSSSPSPSKKKKTEDDTDDLQVALDDISEQTRQVVPSSSCLPVAPPCVIKPTKKKTTSCSNRRQVSLPLESLRSATLRLQYPLLQSLKGKKKYSDQLRLITTSIDIIRCLLAESIWALMRRKNPTESFKLWFSTHDTLSSFLNNGEYDSANKILVQLNKVSINYGLRENNYFELLGEACNTLFGTTLLHNKMFDPDLVSVNQQRLTGDKNTKAKTVLNHVYHPIWAKISERLNMITCGAALIGGKGDMSTLQRCADNVLNNSKNDRLEKIIKEVTARTNQMAKFGVALRPSSSTAKQQQQQQQPLPYPYPPPVFYTNGGLVGFSNNKAAQAAFADLPQFIPVTSSTAPPPLQTQSGITSSSLPAAATSPTGLRFPAPVLFSSYPESSSTAPPKSHPRTSEAPQSNLLRQTTPVFDQEEEESVTDIPAATTTELRPPAPVLFPSYPKLSSTAPPKSYPPASEALQRNLLQQMTHVSDQEEEEEEESATNIPAATTTGLRSHAPVLFPSYPQSSTTPPNSYPPTLQCKLLEQMTHVSDQEEGEEESEVMSDVDERSEYFFDEAWK